MTRNAAPRKVVGIISIMNAGGAQEAMLRLARQLRARGHEMSVWFLYERSAIHRAEPFTRVFYPKPKLSAFEYVGLWFRLVAALRAERPDTVIGFLPLANIFGLTAALVAGIPQRIASHRSPGGTYGRTMRLLDRLVGATKVYRRIVCVSDAVRQSFSGYSKRYRSKLAVIHNGIEWNPSSLRKPEARTALRLPADGFLVVTIGRLNGEKNFGLLLEAVARTEEILLAVAGDGPLRAQLEQQASGLGIANRLFFLGELDRVPLRHLLRAGDAFALPSLFEGQSNAVLEAMHEGLPIIVNDVPANRETVLDRATGEATALLPPNDLDAWSDALQSVRDDPALRDRLAARANALVRRDFTLIRMIDGFEAVIGANDRG